MMTEAKTTTTKNQNILKLSIQVSLDGLSFCGLSVQDNEIVYYKQKDLGHQTDPVKLLNEIQQFYEEEDFLKQDVDEIKLLFSNSLYTLVPRHLFDEKQASNYLKFNVKILKTDFIAHDELFLADAHCVYVPYANIVNYFFDKYGEFEYRHGNSVLVENLLKLKKQPGPTAYLYNRKDYYELVIIENGQLLFCNTFQYDTPEDFLYYLLFAAEQLGLDPMQFDLQVFGEIDKESAVYKIAYTYIKNISIFRPEENYRFGPEVNKATAQKDFILLNAF